MKVEIDEIQADLVVVHSLKRHRQWIKPAWNNVPTFSADPKENKRQVKELRKAFDLVLSYYGVYK